MHWVQHVLVSFFEIPRFRRDCQRSALGHAGNAKTKSGIKVFKIAVLAVDRGPGMQAIVTSKSKLMFLAVSRGFASKPLYCAIKRSEIP